MLYAKVEQYARSRLFWVIVIIISVSLALIGSQLKITYLGFPYTLLMLSSFSLGGTASLSVPLATLYVQAHMKYGKKKSLTYIKSEAHPFSFPKIRTMLRTSVVSVLGMTYLIVSAVPFIDEKTVSGFLLIMFLFLASLMVAPALNVSSWILRKSSIMFENPTDGTRMNLGVDLANKLGWALGPLAIIRLIHLEVTSFPNTGVGFILLGFTIAVAIPSLALTYFLIKQRLPQLSEKLDKKLQRIL